MMKANSEKEAKMMRLKKEGVFNNTHNRVEDDLFREHDFFDEQDVVQVKYEMIRRVENDGWQIARASRAFGFSRPAFYEAQRLFSEKGIWGLVPQKRGPKGGHKITDEILNFVEQKREKEKQIKTSELVKLLEEQCKIKVHRRSLERAIKRWEKK